MALLEVDELSVRFDSDEAEHLPGHQGQRHLVDRVQRPLVRVEADREVPDLEQRLHQRSVFGSKTSRSPSPSRLNASAAITIAIPG